MSTASADIEIMIIEDDAIVAMDLESRLKKLGFGIAGIYGNSDAAINFLKIHYPSLILCDINIDGSKDGVDVAMYVRKHKSIPLIFTTALSDRLTLDRAKKALPYGYIVKPYEDSDLISAIEMAMYKHQIELDRLKITPEKLQSLLLEPLSKREFEIFQDIIEGSSNHEICDKRYISINTTKYHVSNIFRKLSVHSRTELLQKILALFT